MPLINSRFLAKRGARPHNLAAFSPTVMTLLALGLNHQSAPVALRERVALPREQIVQALRALACDSRVTEAAIVSTCNRTEIYCNVADGDETWPAQWLHAQHAMSPRQLDEFLYQHRGEAAVRHLFRVATGLDSLILGEPQVLGQVKEAYHLAREAGTLRAPLERLFQNTFAIAKRVRTDTRIGANPVSVAFAAVRLAQQVFGDLASRTVLLIGAGDTIELVARHLHDQGVHRLIVANRTLENAQALASRFDAQAVPLADFTRPLGEADVVIASTASRETIVEVAHVRHAFTHRRHRPMLLIDLAVPRDIAPEIAQLDDVFLYTVDQLAEVIEDSLRSRREAAREADAMIDLQVGHYMAWWRGVAGHGALRRLRDDAERERDDVLARARQMLATGKPADEALDFLARTLTNKLLHAPSSNLRAAAMRGDHDLMRAAERLFQDDAATRHPIDPDA
jgi:glutamyl-tRNA reductase